MRYALPLRYNRPRDFVKLPAAAAAGASASVLCAPATLQGVLQVFALTAKSLAAREQRVKLLRHLVHSGGVVRLPQIQQQLVNLLVAAHHYVMALHPEEMTLRIRFLLHTRTYEAVRENRLRVDGLTSASPAPTPTPTSSLSKVS